MIENHGPIISAGDIEPAPRMSRTRWILPDLVLLVILALAAFLRFRGLNWDDTSHLHPDERFLTMVETDIQLPDSLGAYFNTANSRLNPNNVGHTFFVYGTLPIFLVRYLAEWVGQTGYDQVQLVGRATSATFDLITVLLVYFIGARLYRKRWIGVLAAAFAAVSVLPIQHAHFFVVDPFANTFIAAGFLFAVLVLDKGRLRDYLLFGLFLGMATASKISAAPLAGVIALAALIRNVRTPLEERQAEGKLAFTGLAAAALMALLAFRIFQPYAFSGPGFLGLRPNPNWLSNLAEIRNQSGGTVDFPPALQWANRTPLLFSFDNLVLWGLGLPLGLLCWVGWLWAAIQCFKGAWNRHLLPVLWIGGFFTWQSISFTKAMRYQLPIYPILVVMAAWGLWQAWQWAAERRSRLAAIARAGTGVAGAGVLLAAATWAIAFSNIYVRPLTRVAASRWIYSHLPAAANLQLDGGTIEPISSTQQALILQGQPISLPFTANLGDSPTAVQLQGASAVGGIGQGVMLQASVTLDSDPAQSIAAGLFQGSIPSDSEPPLQIIFDQAGALVAGESYHLNLQLLAGAGVVLGNQLQLQLQGTEGDVVQPIDLPQQDLVIQTDPGQPLSFISHSNGQASGVMLAHATVLGSQSSSDQIQVRLLSNPGDPQPLASGVLAPVPDGMGGQSLQATFDRPVLIAKDQPYSLRFIFQGPSGIAAHGSEIVNESSWDDGLPLRLDGRDGFGGLYQGLTQELYWQDDQDDNGNGIPDKEERLVNTLNDGDYLIISSNRQYGTIPRVPIRYPLTTAYYHALFGCPAADSVSACAANAQPGNTPGQLGYKLIAVFQSNPSLGPISINDQSAEEAFTVYDHPKVLIFQKTADFSAGKVKALLDQVDMSRVVHVLPSEAGNPPPTLMLPATRLAQEQQGGTWKDLFNRLSLVNQSQIAAVVVWWLLIWLLGVLAFPITRLALSGLKRGIYPLSRLIGLLIVAWGSWMAGSLGVPVSRLTIAGVVMLLALVSATIAWRDWVEIKVWWADHKREVLWVEALALAFFLFDLAVRYGNPDLWHPSKGGEKPMDFSYLNAVLKSTLFPPYDPWFSGGYINYYYFGFVLVGMPIKLLGLIPTVAYNLVIPTWFSLLGLAAYGVGGGLVDSLRPQHDSGVNPRLAGTAAAIGLVVLGNMGTARMLYDGWKRIGTPVDAEPAGGLVGAWEALQGAGKFVTLQEQMPYATDSWYWNPSRAIAPGEGEAGPITEFPYFTFLYADLHAHMINLPFTVLTLGWGLSWLVEARRRKRRWLDWLLAAFIGGLAFGVLRPTNTWDFPVYWSLGALALAGAAWLRHPKLDGRLLLEFVISAAVLFGLALLLFRPYDQWYGQGYNAVDFWKGSRTGLVDYLTVHGAFLFVVVCWMTWETRQWMAQTPLSALNRLRPALGLLLALVAGILAGILVITALGYAIAPLVIPLMLWAGLLFLRPGMPLGKRAVLVMLMTALALTFVVEVVVLRGDISRMNTVFKFYLQVWTLLALSAGAALAWIMAELDQWAELWRGLWTAGIWLVVGAAALYPLLATPAKIGDRMASDAPHTLDGMRFMQNAVYYDLGDSFPLLQDDHAIQWMQDHVAGSPVIVEANIPEYRWGNRFTVYTGLPGVLGWNWHQRQQRVVNGDAAVTERADAITRFYLTQSPAEAMQFLHTYNVSYVIVGRLEHLYYDSIQPCLPADDGVHVICDMSGRPVGMPQPDTLVEACTPLDPQQPQGRLSCPTFGLDKFSAMVQAGELLPVFQEGDTVIYQVVQP
jgi:YYY domain-containing protein